MKKQWMSLSYEEVIKVSELLKNQIGTASMFAGYAQDTSLGKCFGEDDSSWNVYEWFFKRKKEREYEVLVFNLVSSEMNRWLNFKVKISQNGIKFLYCTIRYSAWRKNSMYNNTKRKYLTRRMSKQKNLVLRWARGRPMNKL